MTATSADPTTYVILSHVSPTLGLERVALDLLAALSSEMNLHVVVVSGDIAPVEELGLAVTRLGSREGKELFLAYPARLLQWRLRVRPESVLVVGVWAAVPWLLVSGARVRTVVWEHSLIAEKIGTSKKLRILASVAGRLYRRASLIVCVSEPLRADLCALIPKARVAVINNLIGPEEPDVARTARKRSANEPWMLVCVGSLTRTKAHHEAIEALVQIPHADLHIFGEGPERANLGALALRLGVSSRTHLHGYVAHKKVRDMVKRADIVIHCAAGETFGLAYFEAAQLGCPLVARRNAISSELVPDVVPGVLYNGGDQTDLLRAVSVAQRTDWTASHRQARKLRSERYCVESVVAEWTDVLGAGGRASQ